MLLSGCETKEIIVDQGPLFCDVEERRKFSQEEIDWRSVNAPWNLRRDLATNAAYERHCIEG